MEFLLLLLPMREIRNYFYFVDTTAAAALDVPLCTCDERRSLKGKKHTSRSISTCWNSKRAKSHGKLDLQNGSYFASARVPLIPGFSFPQTIEWHPPCHQKVSVL